MKYEELCGMIWYLAQPSSAIVSPEEKVAEARKRWQEGLECCPRCHGTGRADQGHTCAHGLGGTFASPPRRSEEAPG